MRFFKLSAIISLLILSSNLFAYGIGYTSYPLEVDKNLLSAEFTGILNHGSGVGLQGRFTRKMDDIVSLEAGAGLGAGDRSSRIFAGSDFEIFPDYENQPKFAIKTSVERATEFKDTIMILGATPIVSKGLSFWGQEGFPYVAMPLGIGLNTDDKKYHTRISAVLGINGHIPLEGYKKLVGQIEAQIDLKNTYSGIFLGMSYPLD